MLVLGHPHQHRPGQRALPQVERPAQLVGQDPLDGTVHSGEDPQRYRPVRGDDLNGLTVHGVERGAQRLVPRGQPVERRPERREVERSGQTQPDPGVVFGTARAQVVQEPQAALRGRQRQGTPTRYRHDGLVDPDGRRLNQCRQPGDRRRVEQRAGG